MKLWPTGTPTSTAKLIHALAYIIYLDHRRRVHGTITLMYADCVDDVKENQRISRCIATNERTSSNQEVTVLSNWTLLRGSMGKVTLGSRHTCVPLDCVFAVHIRFVLLFDICNKTISPRACNHRQCEVYTHVFVYYNSLQFLLN
jgi:hypothetical protein